MLSLVEHEKSFRTLGPVLSSQHDGCNTRKDTKNCITNIFFIMGERIQIVLTAGHHRPASETNDVSLAGR